MPLVNCIAKDRRIAIGQLDKLRSAHCRQRHKGLDWETQWFVGKAYFWFYLTDIFDLQLV